jgi:hypothetical protein
LDLDSDGDGIIEGDDNCPANPNEDQADTDLDGIGDACNDSIDIDGDEYANNLDNCPNIANVEQTDTDNDGAGNACDADDDNDGILDEADLQPTVFSDDFANPSGTTFGFIEQRGDVTLSISPRGDNKIQVDAGSRTGPIDAIINACNGQKIKEIGSGDFWDFRCGSIAIDMDVGEIQLSHISPDGSTFNVALNTGDSFFFDDTTLTMESLDGIAEITITADDGTTAQFALDGGNTITHDPELFSFTTPESNTSIVIVTIGGTEVEISPGGILEISHEKIIDLIIRDIEEMVDEQELKKNIGLKLTKNLQSSVKNLETDKIAESCNEIFEFVDEVNQLISDEIFSDQQGQSLIETANVFTNRLCN